MRRNKACVGKAIAIELSIVCVLAIIAAAGARAEEATKTASGIRAIEPADPDLIPEGRRLLEYFQEVKGKGILIGGPARTSGGPRAILHQTGRKPAIRHLAADFLLLPGLAEQTVEAARFWWREEGGIVQYMHHWPDPTNEKGSAWKDKPRGSKPPDLAKMVTPGTEEYKAFHRDMKIVADHLERLDRARVPILWSPFHEIDGGWFWWTDVEKPENTAALWRQMFQYLVTERRIHNLIWVYQAAHACNTIQGQRSAKRGGRNAPGFDRPVNEEELEEEIAFRSRYYPGDRYVDIASLSTYGNRQLGWGNAWEDARKPAYELMARIAPGPGKAGMLAIGECPGMINPVVAERDGPAWVWCLTWYAGASAWDRFAWNHEYLIPLDRLPLFHDGNVKPNVRITHPAEGIEVRGRELHILGAASDRNGNLEGVRVHALAQPWSNWYRLGGQDYVIADEPVREAFEKGIVLGDAQVEPDGRWSYTWRNPPAGFHNIVAIARDEKGAVAASNVIRLSAGIANLARGKEATASIHQAPNVAAGAVDSDPVTGWWAGVPQNRRGEPVVVGPQWLQVDLGEEKTIGAASVHWWAARATHYTVQVSSDGQEWRDVVKVAGQRGEMDIHRFQPVQARYVRLHCTKHAVDWQTYCVFDFGVYERLPEQK